MSKKVYDLDAINDGNSKDERITLNELQKLNKKDKSELSASEIKLRDKYNQTIANAFKGIEKLAYPNIQFPGHYEPNLPDISALPISSPATASQQAKTNRLLQEFLDLSKQINTKPNSKVIQPRYDNKKNILYFANTPIDIDITTDAGRLCKRLFYGGKPVKKPLDKIELTTALLIEDLEQRKASKKIFGAKASLNAKIAQKTTIQDLIVTIGSTIWFNQEYM